MEPNEQKAITVFPGKPELGKPCPLGLLLPGEEYTVIPNGTVVCRVMGVSFSGLKGPCEMRVDHFFRHGAKQSFNSRVYPTHLIDTREIE